MGEQRDNQSCCQTCAFFKLSIHTHYADTTVVTKHGQIEQTSSYKTTIMCTFVILQVFISTPSFQIIGGRNTSILTITSFNESDEGTYVCRSKNLAGVDAGIVALRIGESIDMRLYKGTMEYCLILSD